MVDVDTDVIVLGRISAPVLVQFEPVGRWFESYSRGSHVTSPSHRLSSDEEDSSSEEEEEEEGEGEHTVNPLLLDPTQWKDQDHYAMLGLGKMRYKADTQDIRKAYRQKVLQYHPDKQHATAQGSSAVGGTPAEGDDDYFKCIQIAYDILSNPKRRRAYDSIDPTFDEAIPPNSAHSRENFYDVFRPVFEENARWSKHKPVPLLGDENATLEEVDTFYAFWYDLVSWREFSYLDEDNPEKAESRDERRWMEKQNKASRQKKKKEETARIRTLVDTAYACDPRVKKFKEAEKAEKLAKKRAKEEAARLEALEREKEQQKRLEEEQKKREKEEEEARAQATKAKKEKEMVKKALRKERKSFRAVCKTHDYFAGTDAERVTRMQEMERLCETLSAERLQSLSEQLSQLQVATETEDARLLFDRELSELKRKEAEQLAAAQAKASQSASASRGASVGGDEWTREEVQLLVKAVTLHPSGTVKRWETIAQFVNTHSPSGCRDKSGRQVITKVKALQKLDVGVKDKVNKEAFTTFEKTHSEKGHVEAPPTTRYDAPTPWTAEEQKALENSLRTYPASTPERWEKIAASVGTRTKAECVARFKELVARVKAKKQQS